MARVELENLLTVPLYRALFTGAAYTVEPPVMVPPNATVFWQTDDTGSVTYTASMGGSQPAYVAPPAFSPARSFPGSAYSPVASYPGAVYPPGAGNPTYPPSAPGASVPGGAAPPPTTGPMPTAVVTPPPLMTPATGPQTRHITAPPSGYAVTPSYPPTPTAMNPPASLRDAPSPVTLAWRFSPTGRSHFLTQNVAAGLRVDVRERAGGASYTVSKGRHRRAPASPRRRALKVGSSILGSLLLLATVVATTYGLGALPALANLLHHRNTPQPRAVSAGSAPSLLLTASQPSARVGDSVTLIASIDRPSPPSGYQINIVNIDKVLQLTKPGCASGAVCTITVTSRSPVSITYQAFVEQSFETGVLVASTPVTVTWVPATAPIVRLTATPAADATGAVNVKPGVSVALTATTDRALQRVGYQLAIFDTSGRQVSKTCTSGTSCGAKVQRNAQGSVTYIAYAQATKQRDARVPSSQIQVTWKATAPTGTYSVSLVVSRSNPFVGQQVTLTATASPGVSGTGYEIGIYDTNGNTVSGTCITGTQCSAKVSSASPASNVYRARVDKGGPGSSVATSNAVAVAWAQPNITLAASNEDPPYGASVTLTATSSLPVDGTGYRIQLVELAGGYPLIGQCQSGSGCSGVPPSPGSTTSIQYAALVDSGSVNGAIARSGAVTINWTGPQAGLQISALDETEHCQPFPDVGPIAPDYTFTLYNLQGNIPVGWQFSADNNGGDGNAWATASPSSGVVDVGQTVTVTVSPGAVCGSYNPNPFDGAATLHLSFPQGGYQPDMHLTDTIWPT